MIRCLFNTRQDLLYHRRFLKLIDSCDRVKEWTLLVFVSISKDIDYLQLLKRAIWLVVRSFCNTISSTVVIVEKKKFIPLSHRYKIVYRTRFIVGLCFIVIESRLENQWSYYLTIVFSSSRKSFQLSFTLRSSLLIIIYSSRYSGNYQSDSVIIIHATRIAWINSHYPPINVKKQITDITHNRTLSS